MILHMLLCDSHVVWGGLAGTGAITEA